MRDQKSSHRKPGPKRFGRLPPRNKIYNVFVSRFFQVNEKHLGSLPFEWWARQNLRPLLDYLEALSIKCSDRSSYFIVAQALALVSKYKAHDPSTRRQFDPEHTAWETWLASEESCCATNARIREYKSSPNVSWELGVGINRMRSYIRRVLGETPDIDEVYGECYFSGGASMGVHGDRTHLAAKMLTEEVTATPRTRGHIHAALRASGLFREGVDQSRLDAPPIQSFVDRIRWVSGNKTSFVPKTIKTHRSIAVEPLMNGFLQSGVDAVMRRRLKARLGLDLRDQHSNARLAREGSLFGNWATVDLSSASDSISVELVKQLLPYAWYTLLDELRSPTTCYRGEEIRLNKFVSMGNNFCFPLQTLIFMSACHAVGSTNHRVYGDDIVVGVEYVQPLFKLLQELGFRTNPKKTFFEGPFRESCGADWWSGSLVRPAFAKTDWRDVQSVASFHNVASELWSGYPHLLELLAELRMMVPDRIRFVRPARDPDGGAFNVPLDEAMTSRHVSWDADWQTWVWREYRPMPIVDGSYSGHTWYAWVSFLAFLRGNGGEFVHRRKTRTRICERLAGTDSRVKISLVPALRVTPQE